MSDDPRNKVLDWLIARPRKVWWLATGLAVVGLGVVSGFIGVTHGSARAGCIAGAAFLALIQVGIQWLRDESGKIAARTAEEVAEETRSVTNAAISNAFTPILRVVAQILEAADETQRGVFRGEVMRSVVAAAAGILGPDDTTSVRACFFEMEWDDAEPVRLKWTGRFAGRADEPRSPFEAGTPSGDAAIAMVMNDEYLFCEDVEKTPPAGWDDHTHHYRTFLSVPVRGANQACGMLSIDSLRPGDIVAARDRPILIVLARILALSTIVPERR